MWETARPGDVVLVAYLSDAKWVSRAIQRFTGSWYSHAMIALGGGRYAHARPARSGNIVIIDGEDAMASLIHSRTVYDLFRSEFEPDPELLLAVVEDYRSRSVETPTSRIGPCGGISRFPGVVFSDGNLLALAALRGCLMSPRLLVSDIGLRLRDAVIVATEDGEGRLLCSGFVHRVLDAVGARPAAPPPGRSFIDLSDFPTDEPKLQQMGSPFLVGWLIAKFTAGLDVDWQSMQTLRNVVEVIACHFERRTPVPDPLHVANFLTPGDLGLSPSLRKVASRYRLPTGRDTGWTEPLDLPEFGEPVE